MSVRGLFCITGNVLCFQSYSQWSNGLKPWPLSANQFAKNRRLARLRLTETATKLKAKGAKVQLLQPRQDWAAGIFCSLQVEGCGFVPDYHMDIQSHWYLYSTVQRLGPSPLASRRVRQSPLNRCCGVPGLGLQI